MRNTVKTCKRGACKNYNPMGNEQMKILKVSLNTACIVCKHILNEKRPILYVSHDEDDGCWQFMCGDEHVFTEDARVIALVEAFELDASISQVAGMPCGCFAERESAASDWRIFSRQ